MFLYLLISIFTISFAIMLFITIKANKKWSKINDYLSAVTKIVNSVRYGNLSTKIEKSEHKKYQDLTDSINRMIEALNDREQMIVEYQNEMMKQNTLLATVVNSLSDGILIVNESGVITNATPMIKTWFGTETVAGKNIFEFVEIQNDKKLSELNDDDIFIKHSSINNFIVSSKPITTEEKPLYILIVKDVTKAHEIETLKEDFVATLTHDLKVPIVAESNIVEFLLEGKFGEINDKQQVALLNMQKSNNELRELVQIVLETYKIKDQGITLYKENFYLNDFIKNIVNEMEPIANQSNIHIDYNINGDINIFADSVQLTRVIKNLISNAIYHSNTKDKIDVTAKQNDGFAEISVIDYGQGIGKDEQHMIFNKYYSAANKFRKIGTGLGLYLSQQIALSHGGEITVTSEENVRTEFCVKIPN